MRERLMVRVMMGERCIIFNSEKVIGKGKGEG